MMKTDHEQLISAEKIVKIYHGKTVVSEVDLNVKRGEIVGLLGPNGAGKTTTFYMMLGLIKPDSGTILFDDVNITNLPVYKRARLGVGYLAQEPSIFRKLTVEENVLAILETVEPSSAKRAKRMTELMEELGMAKLAKQKAFTLSGGERRKLEITRALVTEPSILMLDEPFSGVDPIAVNDIKEIITDLSKKGLGILITDHNVRETLSIVDRAYLLFEGKVLREGTGSFLTEDKMSRELYLGDKFSM